MSRALVTLNLQDFLSNDSDRKAQFITGMGDALKDIGFFALEGHGIDLDLISKAYAVSADYFAQPEDVKTLDQRKEIGYQRGWTPFGQEHAKDSSAFDLKEFWQTGRSHADAENPTYPENVWPQNPPHFKQIIDQLYRDLEGLSQQLLRSASVYLGKDEDYFQEITREGNTIMRMIHYPPVGQTIPAGSVRSAAHEDINLITMLVGSTAAGLQVQDHDGSWINVEAKHDHIIVDSGDMIQSLTNGLFKSTTHRVVNPDDSSSARYSMPMFVHARSDVPIGPRPEFVELTGGQENYPHMTAGEYLHQRLVEIGVLEE